MAKRKQPEVRRVTTQQRLSRQNSHSSSALYIPVAVVVFIIGVLFAYSAGWLNPDTGAESVIMIEELLTQKKYDKALYEISMVQTTNKEARKRLGEIKGEIAAIKHAADSRKLFQQRWKREYLDLKETMTRDEKRKAIVLFLRQYKGTEHEPLIRKELKAFGAEAFQ